MSENKAFDCHSQINNNFLNRCFIIENAIVFREFISNFFTIIYPWNLLSVMLILIAALPFIFTNTSRTLQAKALRIYNVARFTLLSIFHRIAYVYTIAPAFQYFIRQPAPCYCASIGGYGLYFNLPYIYSLSSTIIGLILWDFASFMPKVLYALSLFIIIVPSLCYIMAGWASVGQALFSMFFAACLNFIAKRTSNKVMLIEDIILLVFNLIMIIVAGTTLDDMWRRREVIPNMINSFMALFCELFLVIDFLRVNNWSYFTVEKGMMLVYDDSVTLRSSLLTGEQTEEFAQRMKTDKIDGLVAFGIDMIMMTFRYLFYHWNGE